MRLQIVIQDIAVNRDTTFKKWNLIPSKQQARITVWLHFRPKLAK